MDTINSKIQRDRYQIFIEDIADGIYETDLKGRFVLINNALCRMFGYPKEEIQNRSFRDFMDTESAKVAFEDFNSVYRTGKGRESLEWSITRQDGENRVIDVSVNLIIGDDGEKIGFRGVAHDVTDEHNARKALEESERRAHEQYLASRRAEQRYRALLDFLPHPAFVFNVDSTVSYLNPAFVKVFGWSQEEVEGRHIPFVPEFEKEKTRAGIKKLFKDKALHGFETKRLTKDGRILDILIDGALFFDDQNEPAGQVISLRDITEEKRNQRINQALFRIAKALYQFRGLDERLDFITNEVKSLLSVEGTLVILLDEGKKEFFFRSAAYDDSESEKRFREVRFPVDEGVAGQVYRTGEPIIVPDYYQSPYFTGSVDAQTGSKTRNMLDVPIRTQDHMIGVLCIVNKKEGNFEQRDVDLLETIANMVALPIENARINEALERSYEEVKSMNRAKDRVIHHLSHELKTPVSVLSASLGLLSKKLEVIENSGWKNIMTRAQRNLQRILEMQYEIEDILREGDYKTHQMMSALLDACVDELEVLLVDEGGDDNLLERIRNRIDQIFRPRESVPEKIELKTFFENCYQVIRPKFNHRRVTVQTQLSQTKPIFIPPDVLKKIIEGILKNAVENTPDGGLIEVILKNDNNNVLFQIRDFGIGITDANKDLIFESYFSTAETMQYSSRKAYDFNAGGKGFDLLRMKIFSERYHFKLEMESTRCRYLPRDEDLCPGDLEKCEYCQSQKDCIGSGGTTITIRFPVFDNAGSD
jgi:PAS domain S-box-containing protein